MEPSITFGPHHRQQGRKILTDEMKDKIIIVLVTVFLTNAGWFMLWLKDIPTLQELEERPPIYKAIPNLKQALETAGESQKIIQSMVSQQVELQASQRTLTAATNELKDTVRQLSKDIQDMRVLMAKNSNH